MKGAKKRTLILAMILPIMGFFISPSVCIAADSSSSVIAASPIKEGIDKSKNTTGMGNKGSDGDVNDIVQTIITILIWLVGVLAVIMIIYGGILFVTSGGDPAKTKKGKDTILYGIIGLVVAILAFVIVNFVINTVGPS